MNVLSEATADEDPIRLFESWFAAAAAAGVPQPEAMALATASCDGRPSVRMVLLKSFDHCGFVFYSNYESKKGLQLDQCPHAALVFYWTDLHRQIRIEGSVERLTADESDRYFETRPRASRIAAAASQQSRPLESRDVLERRVGELEREYEGEPVPRPPYWGGYRVTPSMIEFWQNRPDRLHDRLQYCRRPDGTWVRQRLSP